MKNFLLYLSLAAWTVSVAHAAEPTFTRQFDLIYHKQDGFALTMERVAPTRHSNGAAVVLIMSGGWISSHDHTKPHQADRLPGFFEMAAAELLGHGYTLFYVVHGTQPKFTIREIHGQIDAAVRHIRQYGARYQIDPSRIGIMGGSAGGHLALMQATNGDYGQPNPQQAEDQSSRVQAVVAYYPPTDFVNYGREGVFFDGVVRGVMPDGGNPFLQAVDYLEYDAKNIRLTKVTDAARLAEHYRFISPRYHVSNDDPPTLLLHGDVDKLVPMQQSELIAEQFEQVGVPHKLFIKKGGDHGWQSTPTEVEMLAGWFDDHLND
jgi:acetyl esterase/lipase